MFDIIFKDAVIVDGSGRDLYRADVGVKGGRIAQIGRLDEAAQRTVNCKGLVLAPGFIDIHSHGDLSIPAFPNMESCLLQGITTVFAGHCGMSASPADKYWRHTFYEGPAFKEVIPPPPGGQIPANGQILETEALRPAFQKVFGFDLDWTHIGEYFDHLQRNGIGGNLACVVGHGQIRQQVMGPDDEREASPAEIEEMKKYLRQAMEHGARGMSFGLDYPPGAYASEEELLEMARCLREYDGLLTTHCQRRDFRRGVRAKQYYIDGLREVLDIALATGVQLHVSHLCCGYEVNPADPALCQDAAKRTLDLMEAYRGKGVRVTWDVIPRGCGGQMFHLPYLATKMIPYVDQCGGLQAFSEKLKLPAYRAGLSRDIKRGNHLSRSPFTRLDPLEAPHWADDAEITSSRNEALVGKTVGQLAAERGRHFADVILDLIEEDPFICYRRTEEYENPAIDYFTSLPEASVCLDGGVYSLDYLPAEDYPVDFPAPSTYCGMVKFLRRELDRGCPIEKTVAKMTGNSARCIGLRDRGFIREGYAADLVLLDLARLDAKENQVDPRQAPEGISCVVVNGIIEVEQQKCLRQKAGRTLPYPF